MYGRLNRVYGWAWKYEDGTLGPFVLFNLEQYAGMFVGYTPDGRRCCRPRTEFEALSHDGETWYPTPELLSQVPQESRSVRTNDVPLPEEFE